MMIYSMLRSSRFPYAFSAYVGTSILVFCLTMHVHAQQFSQDFITAVNEKKSTIKTKNQGFNLYHIGSCVITATAIFYATYGIYLVYKNSNNPSFMQSYILPTWISDCNNTSTLILGVTRIAIKTLLYKTVAQILLALSTCSLKDNLDYLFTNRYADD